MCVCNVFINTYQLKQNTTHVETVMVYGGELWVENKSQKEATGSRNELPTT
jgi:hypothetical protein